MKSLLISTGLILISLISKAQVFNPFLATMLQDTLNTYVAGIPNIKGMAASVYIPGQGIWKGAAGLSYSGNPISTDMRFGIASNTKTFVAVMMLKLAERGALSLNDSLGKYLGTYPNINSNITIRQLLNHTSGVADPFAVQAWIDTVNKYPTRTFTPNEVLSWVGTPLFLPGTSYSYSNTNYILAGMVAESATGFHISRLIRDSILTPLNLDSTFIDVREPSQSITAHRWWNGVDYHDTSRVGLNTSAGCAGFVFSTVSEMVQWYTGLFNKQIINQNSLNSMTNFGNTGQANYQYGLGFTRETTQGRTYWGHGGNTWGYKSKMIYDSCLKVSVCGLSNSFPAGMDGVLFLLYRVVANHIPGCSGTISGLSNVCRGTNNVIYTVPAILNATSYSWTLPNGVTGTSNTNSISVNFGATAVSGTISVTGINIYGPGGSSSINVTVNSAPVVGFSVNNYVQQLGGNSFVFTDTSTGINNTRLWNFGDASTNNVVSPIKNYVLSNIYAVKLRVGNLAGCSDSITKNVSVLPNAPSLSSSNLVFSNRSNTGMTLSWTSGNGQRRMVLAKALSAPNASPQNGAGYNPNTVFGSGSQLGSGNFVVYRGVGNTVTVTGLNLNTQYYFSVIEFNGDTNLSSYQTTPYLNGNQSTLPVTWLDFSAELNEGNQVRLNWSTAGETNNSHFLIERKVDPTQMEEWQTIGRVYGNGTKNAISHYMYTDDIQTAINNQQKIIYYRLKQVDFDENSACSGIVYVDLLQRMDEITVRVYPNPGNGSFTLDCSLLNLLNRVYIYDMQGNLITEVVDANQNKKIDFDGFFPGLYLVNVISGDRIYKLKLAVK